MPRGVRKVPQVMQMEALECGAACLTMILAYYGRWVPLEQVRMDCGVSRDGSKASNILRAARRYGLNARGVACSVNRLAQMDSPCVLYWNFNHYVVFDGFHGRYAYLNDPARGEVRVTMEEFDAAFTGVVLKFAPNESFEPGGAPPSTIAFARRRLRGLKAPIAFVLLSTALFSILGIVSTSLSQIFIDKVLPSDDPDWIRWLAWLMAVLALFSAGAQGVTAVYLMRMRGRLAVVSSSRFMRHLLHLPSEFYEQRMVGDLQQRQSSNETVAFSLVEQIAPQLMNAAMLVLYLVVMLHRSVALTLVGVLVVVTNGFVARDLSRRRVNISRSMASAVGKQYATAVAGIDAIETIKAAGAETGYFQRWSGYQATVSNDNVRTIELNSYLGSLPGALTELANILVLVLGTYLISQQQLTQGALLMFQGLLSSFMSPVMGIIGLGQTVQEVRSHMERIDDVMRYEPDVAEDPADEADVRMVSEFGRDKLLGELDLRGVTFGYSPLEDPIIEDFDLHVDPGQWVALVGSSGSGKSTLAKLISGLYRPWSGEVRFDGVDIQDVPKPVLRGSVAVVDQHISTFDDTIADNIRLWDNSIEDFEIIMACRDAHIHDEIVSREDAYLSRVLPGGRNFSGGQLQRIEIARALAVDPTVLILDEATSALDSSIEERVIKAIRDRGITCVVVAHRLSAIRDCDQIIVLEDGKIRERGTHDELLSAGGSYAALVGSD